jgi:hypothetical protein
LCRLANHDGSVSSVSWILLYRASLSGYEAADFHQACDEMEKCVVVVKAENGRIAAAYNEDGFFSGVGRSPNLKGFIISTNIMDVETYSIEMIMEWESTIIPMVVLGLGRIPLISISQTIVTKASILGADWVNRTEEDLE